MRNTSGGLDIDEYDQNGAINNDIEEEDAADNLYRSRDSSNAINFISQGKSSHSIAR